MLLEYRLVIAQLYEQVKSQLEMNNGFSKYFLSNMGPSKGAHSLPNSLIYASINLKKKETGLQRKEWMTQNSLVSLFL